MKRTILLLIPLLAACGAETSDKAGRELRGDKPARETAQRADSEVKEITTLAGLYEAAGEGGKRARMCMVSASAGATSFGIATDTPGGGSCGGAGEAVREGNVLRLTMTGDEACVIPAQIAGRRVRFPASLPQGCDYYCGPGASLAGAILEKTGDTKEDAMRATDLAGDPLCG